MGIRFFEKVSKAVIEAPVRYRTEVSRREAALKREREEFYSTMKKLEKLLSASNILEGDRQALIPKDQDLIELQQVAEKLYPKGNKHLVWFGSAKNMDHLFCPCREGEPLENPTPNAWVLFLRDFISFNSPDGVRK